MIRLLILFLIMASCFSGVARASSNPDNMLTDREREKVVELSKVYSVNMLQRYCMDSMSRDLNGMTSSEIREHPEEYKKLSGACKCLSEQAQKKLTSDDILNYLLVYYGYFTLETEKAVSDFRAKYFFSEEAGKFHRAFFDPQVKKKCGFRK